MTNSKILKPKMLVSSLLCLCLCLVPACGSSGGGEFEDVCADVCSHRYQCEPGGGSPTAQSICIDDCVGILEDGEETDGQACVDARLALFDELDTLGCTQLLTYLATILTISSSGKLQDGDAIPGGGQASGSCDRPDAAPADCCDINAVDCGEAGLDAVVTACEFSFIFGT
ncbi:MAG: hypothetical protein GY733_21035 [bacterium]|nr:hypothetical protein [bacterium]